VSYPSHASGGDISNQLADGAIQFGQGEEAAVAQPRQNPALHNLHADLDFRLVARLVLSTVRGISPIVGFEYSPLGWQQ
jgi:hypothetical protein